MKGRFGAAGLLLGALAGACADEGGFAPLPPTAASVVVARLSAGVTGMTAHDAASPLRLAPPAAPDRIVLLTYEQPLDRLGLAAGAIEPGRCNRSCALAAPAGSFELGEGSLEAAPVPAEILLALVPDRAERCELCVDFEQVLVPVPIHGQMSATFATRAEDGSVLIGVRTATNAEIFRLSPDLGLETACAQPPHFVSGVYTGSGRLWLAAANPPVLHELDLDDVAPDGSCRVRTTTVAPVRGILGMDGGTGGSGVELIVVTAAADVAGYDGRSFRVFGNVDTLQSSRDRVVWLGPGRAAAVGDTGAAIRVEGWEPRAERVPLSGAQYVTSACAHPELGLVLGVGERDVLVEAHEALFTSRSPDQWSSFEARGLDSKGDLLAYRSGVLVGSSGGLYKLVYPGESVVCPEKVGFTRERVYVMAALGDESAVFADINTHGSGENVFGVLRRARAECR